MRPFSILSAMAVATLAVAVPSPAQAPVDRPLQFHNRCPVPVRYFIYHRHADGTWQTHGWYMAPANQPLRDILTAEREPVVHLEGAALYTYAESTSGPTRTWFGRQPVTFNGARYSLRRATLTVGGGKFQFGVHCDPPASSAGVVPSSAPDRTPSRRAAAPARSSAAACPRNARNISGSATCGCTAQAVAEGPVWGSGPYTADSRICRAALHAGVVGIRGGNVSVRIVPGLRSYSGGTRNGVNAHGWGSYGTAFVFDR